MEKRLKSRRMPERGVVPRREEEAGEYPRRHFPFKGVGVLLVLVLLYWLVLGGGVKWFLPSSQAGATARLSQTGEVCVREALPISVSCGEMCGTANFQKAGLSFSCWSGQVAILPNLRPQTPATFTFPAGIITILFPAVDVEVPLVQTRVVQTAKVSIPEVIVPPVRPLPTPEPVPRTVPPPVKVSPPVRVFPKVKPAPTPIVRQPIQGKSACSIALSFTVSAMFASSPCFSDRVEWGMDGRVWNSMQAREVGPWYESSLLPPVGSRICFRVNKKAYCASKVEGGGTYTFTLVP